MAAAIGWTAAEPVAWRSFAVATLGMAVPVVAGLLTGETGAGLTIGLGAVLLAGEAGPGAERPSPGSAIVPAVLAVAAATVIAGRAWTDGAAIVLAGLAAALSGYSRPLGVASIRFIIYFVLALGLLDGAGAHRGAAALLFGLGALWNVAVRTMFSARILPAAAAAPRGPTPAQRRAHWWRTLRRPAGWQFPARLMLGLGAATLIRHMWPTHHYFWIVVTVALLTQRPIERLPVKITQRALGTLAGVGITWALLSGIGSWVLLAALVCLLAACVPFARARSYLLYSAIATPLILIVVDLGKPVETALLTDRLVATIAAAAIVVVLNLTFELVIPPPPAR